MFLATPIRSATPTSLHSNSDSEALSESPLELESSGEPKTTRAFQETHRLGAQELVFEVRQSDDPFRALGYGAVSEAAQVLWHDSGTLSAEEQSKIEDLLHGEMRTSIGFLP
ncbi:MAG: hypothetical protein AAF355_01365 [Myxococcota bacterium]